MQKCPERQANKKILPVAYYFNQPFWRAPYSDLVLNIIRLFNRFDKKKIKQYSICTAIIAVSRHEL